VETDRRQAEATDDHGRLAGLVGQELQDGTGGPDELLRGDVRPAADDQPRREAVAGSVVFDEPERRERPQVAVDRGHRRVEQHTELVGADLAAVGDRQEQPQPAGERGVLGRLLRRSIPGRPPIASLGIVLPMVGGPPDERRRGSGMLGVDPGSATGEAGIVSRTAVRTRHL
jgi:hypothetical protein